MQENRHCPTFASRLELYHYINDTYLSKGEVPLDFFEFGVYRGDSLRAWSAMNKNPTARFYGFDSFYGLPEYWKAGRPKGTFDMGGKTPEISDARIRLIEGLFQQTLPEFLKSYVPSGQIVIHNDCDLYSSTLFCLTHMDSTMLPGTMLIFDEFDDLFHEFRAFCDYTDAYRRNYELMAGTSTLTQAAFLFI